MRQILAAEGFHILFAKHGVDALSVAATHAATIDLIVTDGYISQMSSVHLVNVARQSNPTLRCLVIAGDSEFADALEAFRGTFTAFLHKPVSGAALAAAARALLDRPVPPDRK